MWLNNDTFVICTLLYFEYSQNKITVKHLLDDPVHSLVSHDDPTVAKFNSVLFFKINILFPVAGAGLRRRRGLNASKES